MDRAHREAAAAYRARGQQAPWETILTNSAKRAGARLPDAGRLAEAIWRGVPDAVVAPVAAATVRRLRRSGVIPVLVCNTQRTLAARQRTLGEAGIADCFTALVLSSVVGVGKPDPRFYGAVTTTAREATGFGPDGVVFVGDTVVQSAAVRQSARATLYSPTLSSYRMINSTVLSNARYGPSSHS